MGCVSSGENQGPDVMSQPHLDPSVGGRGGGEVMSGNRVKALTAGPLSCSGASPLGRDVTTGRAQRPELLMSSLDQLSKQRYA